MILFEYDKKKYEKLLREHIREEEREAGREERTAEIFLKMLTDGISRERAQSLTGLDDEKATMIVREKNKYSVG